MVEGFADVSLSDGEPRVKVCYVAFGDDAPTWMPVRKIKDDKPEMVGESLARIMESGSQRQRETAVSF